MRSQRGRRRRRELRVSDELGGEPPVVLENRNSVSFLVFEKRNSVSGACKRKLTVVDPAVLPPSPAGAGNGFPRIALTAANDHPSARRFNQLLLIVLV